MRKYRTYSLFLPDTKLTVSVSATDSKKLVAASSFSQVVDIDGFTCEMYLLPNGVVHTVSYKEC